MQCQTLTGAAATAICIQDAGARPDGLWERRSRVLSVVPEAKCRFRLSLDVVWGVLTDGRA